MAQMDEPWANGPIVELARDWKEYRTGGAVRAPPEKGVRRSLLCIGWMVLHLYEIIALTVFGAAWREPALTAFWLLATLIAGAMYLHIVFSDPGFVSQPMLQRLVDENGGGIDASGSDIVRTLLPADERQPNGTKPEADDSAGAANEAQAALQAAGSSSSSEIHLDRKGAPHVQPAGTDAGGAESCEGGGTSGAAGWKGPVELEEGRDDARAESTEVHVALVSDGTASDKEKPRYVVQGKAARYFYDFAPDVGMLVPIRGKFCKKHGRVVGKFDHYCYLLGNSVGELNHGHFWRLLLVQSVSIWLAKGLVDRSYLHFDRGSPWAVANLPLMLVDILAYLFGVPLAMLLLIHSYLAATSTTTYEFIKMEKLSYLKGFYEFSCPFSEGLCSNLRHFCCPRAVRLWERPPPESEWPETWWRNRYYSCFG